MKFWDVIKQAAFTMAIEEAQMFEAWTWVYVFSQLLLR